MASQLEGAMGLLRQPLDAALPPGPSLSGRGESHFGISSPLWDLVFGTFRSQRAVKPAPVSADGEVARP